MNVSMHENQTNRNKLTLAAYPACYSGGAFINLTISDGSGEVELYFRDPASMRAMSEVLLRAASELDAVNACKAEVRS